jgi:TadE-like protein
MSMKDSTVFRGRFRRRGQSIVEFALMAPILLILLSGIFEFGFMFSSYLSVIDAARNSARFSSDSAYDHPDPVTDCDKTTDFYRLTACLAILELADEQPTIMLCLPDPKRPATENCNPGDTFSGDEKDKFDDIIISVFSVLREDQSDPMGSSEAGLYTAITRFPDNTGEQGWSYAADLVLQDQVKERKGLHASQFSSTQVSAMLYHRWNPEAGKWEQANSTGYLMVEINYHYWQALAMPWFTQFVKNPVLFRVYSIWPLTSAEPTSTT